MNTAVDHAQHTPYSNPGRFVNLLTQVPTDVTELATVARNVIVHYRASGYELPVETRNDINARWLEDMLAADQSRHGTQLDKPRDPPRRVQGCCRDHTLFCVGALRSHGIPARSRVGFAGYFVDGWHHDHVVVEAWRQGRWFRFDSEIDSPRPGLPTPTDFGPSAVDGTGFVTAAQVWLAHRRGEIDPETYGVDPNVPVLRGERFLFNEVIYEVGHRFGDELLLWDNWGRMGEPGEPVSDDDAVWLDAIADPLLAADAGDAEAERELLHRYRSDDGMHPGPKVLQASPFGDPPVSAHLDRR